MITLYGFGRVHPLVIGETRDLRVEWALQETELPYRVHGLDHTGGELDGEAYSRLSYFHQVPVIDDEGFIVAESGAILLYLAQKAGKLIPADVEGRTRVMQWCFAALTTLEPPLAEIQMLDHFRVAKDATQQRERMMNWAERGLTGVEHRLGQTPWIAGPDFTVADILLTMVLREVRRSNLIDDYPTLKAYYARAFARPAWQRATESYVKRLGVTVADIQ